MARWKREERATGLARVVQGFRSYSLYANECPLARIISASSGRTSVADPEIKYAIRIDDQWRYSKASWPNTPEGLKACKAAVTARLSVIGASNA